MSEMVDRFIEEWHRIVEARDTERMADMLSEQVVFRSPVFWKEHEGKGYAAQLLAILTNVFDTFEYGMVYKCDRDLCFQFEASAMGKSLRGVDLISLDDAGKIRSLEVMIRPLNGLMALGEKVQAMFAGSPG